MSLSFFQGSGAPCGCATDKIVLQYLSLSRALEATMHQLVQLFSSSHSCTSPIAWRDHVPKCSCSSIVPCPSHVERVSLKVNSFDSEGGLFDQFFL